MDLFYQVVWIYAAPDKFLFDLQMLSLYPMISRIYTFFKSYFRCHHPKMTKFNDLTNMGWQWDLAQFRLLKRLTAHAATI